MDVFVKLEQLHTEMDKVRATKERSEDILARQKQELQLLEAEALKVLLNEKDEGSKGRLVGNVVLSVKKVPPKPIITDETKIPKKFLRTKTEVDKTAINKAFKEGEAIPGVSLDNGGYTIARSANLKG